MNKSRGRSGGRIPSGDMKWNGMEHESRRSSEGKEKKKVGGPRASELSFFFFSPPRRRRSFMHEDQVEEDSDSGGILDGCGGRRRLTRPSFLHFRRDAPLGRGIGRKPRSLPPSPESSLIHLMEEILSFPFLVPPHLCCLWEGREASAAAVRRTAPAGL